MRMSLPRIHEALKLFIALVIGYSFRIFTENSGTNSLKNCPTCISCTRSPDEDLLSPDGRVQLREQFKPKNRHEVIRYQYFNSSFMYDNFDNKPKAPVSGHRKADVRDIVTEAMASINSGVEKQWTMKKLLNGYRRFDPLRGEEYILDIEIAKIVETPDLPKTPKNPITEVRRFQIVKPFNTIQTLSMQNVVDAKMIHFILPVSCNLEDRLETFLTHFEKTCLESKEHCFLVVILFCGKSERDQEKAKDIQERVEGLRRKFRGAHVRYVHTSKEFSRALGLDLGAKQLPAEALLFFCDTDVAFSKDFLTRCRQNTALNQQVYYPVVFAQHDPDIVLHYSPKKKKVPTATLR